MITAEHLSYSYTIPEHEPVLALQDLNLKVERGEFVAIIGHNGSGKSTFAKLVNAIYQPTKGHVLVYGMDTQDENRLWEIRRTAGLVFQNPDNQIVATLVEEDVAFGPENLGVHPDEIMKRVEDALESVGMSAHRHKPPHLLSGGQKQRVAIAGILAMKPLCIILDEPTAMLDPRGRHEVIETLQYLNRTEKITIVLITHFMEEAVRADRVIVMDGGRKLLDGSPSQVFGNVEQLQTVGLDVPQVTLLAHQLREAGVDLPADILTVEEMVEALCRLK